MNENLIDKISKIQHWQYSSKSKHAGWIKCEQDEGVVFSKDLHKALKRLKLKGSLRLN